LLESNFPEIQQACHIESNQLLALSPILSFRNELIEISGYYSVDADFFNVFDFFFLSFDEFQVRLV